MIYACNGIIPPKEWYHDPKHRNSDNETVRDILKENNKNIPEYWLLN